MPAWPFRLSFALSRVVMMAFLPFPPVSYTHLDVYKRQIMDKAMGFMEDVPDILTGKTCPWKIRCV